MSQSNCLSFPASDVSKDLDASQKTPRPKSASKAQPARPAKPEGKQEGKDKEVKSETKAKPTKLKPKPDKSEEKLTG